jgi:hypothetical protein
VREIKSRLLKKGYTNVRMVDPLEVCGEARLLKKGYANVRMVDPLEVFGAAASVEAARTLMVDQVHMTAAGYAKLATSIKELAHAWMLGRKRKSTGSDRPDAKRIRLDSGGGRGKGGKSGRGKSGQSGRKGDGRGPSAGKKKGCSGE